MNSDLSNKELQARLTAMFEQRGDWTALKQANAHWIRKQSRIPSENDDIIPFRFRLVPFSFERSWGVYTVRGRGGLECFAKRWNYHRQESRRLYGG